MSNFSDFVIEGGRLIKYSGADKNAVIPEGVTAIESFAFKGCTGVLSIVIPATVGEIGHYAVSGCCELEKIEVAEGNKKFFSAGNCVVDEYRRAVVLGCKSSVIPSDGSVEAIAEFAFAGCVALERIEIPSTVTFIGDYAFDGCYNLEDVTLPDSVTYLGRSAFEGCECFRSIVLPGSITCISDHVFKDCTCLENVVASDELISIGIGVFEGCGDELVITAPHLSNIEDYAVKNGIKVKLI